MCLVIVHRCMGHLHGLSKSLQPRSLDVTTTLKNVSLVKSSIQDCHDKGDAFHSSLFTQAVTIAESVETEVAKPS